MTKRGVRQAVAIMTMGLLLLSVGFFLNGCITVGGKEVKSFTEMTPKEKSIFLMTTYSKQYDDYVQLWKQPDRTEAQQEILEKKYEWLQKIYPYIDTYTTYAAGGVMPPAETERIVLNLINDALGL